MKRAASMSRNLPARASEIGICKSHAKARYRPGAVTISYLVEGVVSVDCGWIFGCSIIGSRGLIDLLALILFLSEALPLKLAGVFTGFWCYRRFDPGVVVCVESRCVFLRFSRPLRAELVASDSVRDC